ncbi:MAG: hypothetical protein D6736_18075, partial [Nitrospinota bacterium]
QALSLLEEIVEAEPQNPLFRYHLGMVYLKTDARRLALASLKTALELGIDEEYRAEIRKVMR